MIHYVIYHMVSDRPGPYTVREFTVTAEGVSPGAAQDAPSLDQARECIPFGMTCIPRYSEDDPCIVEVWV